ncbi:hypothetical protein SAMN03097699_0763 [Flavobacteriaceae bacterium MAR_2010_188]|nr:hypothetical protein SAMN03097699_0763 [Flavobacteriaceae bacterium MAR_2010_188]
MTPLIPVYQIEIRYSPSLEFSREYRNILAPFIKLSTKFNITKENTIEEAVSFFYDESDTVIIFSWDRLVLKSHGNPTKKFVANSFIDIPFLKLHKARLEKFEYCEVHNVLVAVNYILPQSDNLTEVSSSQKFSDFIRMPDNILTGVTDWAIVLDNRQKGDSESIAFGNYKGAMELNNRSLRPIDTVDLKEFDVKGFLVEYKNLVNSGEISKKVLEDLFKGANAAIKNLWKQIQLK